MKPTVYDKQGKDSLNSLAGVPQTRLPAMRSNTHAAKPIRSSQGTGSSNQHGWDREGWRRLTERKFVFLLRCTKVEVLSVPAALLENVDV